MESCQLTVVQTVKGAYAIFRNNCHLEVVYESGKNEFEKFHALRRC